VHVRFSREGPFVPLIITVIRTIPGSVTPFLFGSDSMRKCMATIGYTGDLNAPMPKVTFNNPLQMTVASYDASLAETLKCIAQYELQPGEVAECTFEMHPAKPLLRFKEVIINPNYWDDVQIMPSKTNLEYNCVLDCYTAQGCVANLTNSCIKGTVSGSWEECKGFTAYPITAENRD
jgi:hypothetical protein